MGRTASRRTAAAACGGIMVAAIVAAPAGSTPPNPVPAADPAADHAAEGPRPIEPGFVLPEADRPRVERLMTDERYVLGFDMKRISGEPEHLARYHGDVVLMVNVASECGYTRQYEPLEALYRERRDDGLVVLGFPSNEFGGQEPGSNEEIALFCTDRFDVSFPMFQKLTVRGDERHPLYERLGGLPEPIGGAPRWNFTKFLVGRDGRVIARFEPNVEPDDPAFLRALNAALEASRPSGLGG